MMDAETIRQQHKRALRRLANENNRLGALAQQLLENGEGDR